jgi:hypothetical protein
VSGIAVAGPITDTYSEVAPQTALDGTKMNGNLTNLKNAVNNIADNNLNSTLKTEVDKIQGIINNTQAGTLKTQVDKIDGIINGSAALNATCNGNNANDVMVRVGSICVDKYPASIWDGTGAAAGGTTSLPGGCGADGSGCTNTTWVAQSRATPGSALKDGTVITWSMAARACANAGKRLLTPGEWMMARSFGSTVVSGMFTDGNSEWVDIVVATPDTTGATGNGVFGVGRMGVDIGGSPGSTGPGNPGFVALDTATDLTNATVGFRCAR